MVIYLITYKKNIRLCTLTIIKRSLYERIKLLKNTIEKRDR